MRKLPLFSLLCSSENGTIPKVHLMNTGEWHRPWGMVTGQREVVIDHLWSYWPSIIGRSALNVVDRSKLLAEPVLTAVEGKTRHGNAFQANVCTNTPLIMFMTQKGMVLDSQTTNRAFQCVMAQETKCAFWFQMACKPNKHIKLNLYHTQFKRQSMHAQCNAT